MPRKADEPDGDERAALAARVGELTAQVEALTAELRAVTRAVSHDLRAPLRAIDGFATALEEDAGTALPEAACGHLAQIRRAAARMRALIDALLRLADLGRVELVPMDVDLSALAAEVAEQRRGAAPARRVELTIAPGLRARGDVMLLRTVFEHLLDNAWRYTAKRPEAHVAVGGATIDGTPAFFVRDDGAGFDPAHADKLFQPFQRLHSRDDFDGVGLGLAMVRRIIHRHGGRVWAEGAVGGGATFYFTLS